MELGGLIDALKFAQARADLPNATEVMVSIPYQPDEGQYNDRMARIIAIELADDTVRIVTELI